MNGSYICDHDQFNQTKDQFVNLFTMNKKNKKKKKITVQLQELL